MQAKIIKELGLAPLWLKKSTAADSQAPAAAARAAPPPPITAATTAATAAVTAATTTVKTTAIAPVAKMSWEQLRTAVEGCRLCELCERRTQPAFGVGDRQATVMFIGEGPGEEEDRQGKPFVGRAGKLLDLMLHAIELDRKNNVYIANIVKCRPPGNRNPTTAEAQQCLPYLQRQIALVQPHLLVALGKIAATQLLGTETSIAQLRQKMHEYQNIPLVVTYHPAYLLRSPQEKRKSWEDLKFIRRFLAEEK